MIFNFIRYLNPTWYYNLKPQEDHNYFLNKDVLNIENADFLPDRNYKSKIASQRDLAWRMFQEGWIGVHNGEAINIWDNKKIPVEDEYRFIRKYFGSYWSWYVLFLRIVTFKNPIIEFRGFIKNFKVTPYLYDFTSSKNIIEEVGKLKLTSHPFVSIIIPTLNRYKLLKDVIYDLENQSYPNFEVIIIDQTEPFNEDFYKGLSAKFIVEKQKEKALWLARNTAIKMAKGELILLYDDDSRVNSDWIEQHLRCLVYFNADISSGVSISKVGGRITENYRIFKWSEQLDTGNVMVRKEVFKKIGLFDRQFEKQRMGDGEFGLRAYLAGFKNINNPLAERLHLKAEEGGLRQMGSWDEFRPKKLFAPRPIPSVLYLYRKYFGRRIAIQGLLMGLPKSIVPYRFKGNKKKLIFGYIFSIFLSPFLFIVASLSWHRSSKMLNEGAKIEKI